MQIGKMDQQVTLQSASVSRGAIGGHTETWTDIATVWANIRDLSGREINAAQAAGSAISKVVTIWYRTDVNARCRVKLPDNTFARIAHLREIQRKRGLELYCESINA